MTLYVIRSGDRAVDYFWILDEAIAETKRLLANYIDQLDRCSVHGFNETPQTFTDRQGSIVFWTGVSGSNLMVQEVTVKGSPLHVLAAQAE